MKYLVRRFKNLELALKELEPFIKKGFPLHTGKPFNNFGRMRPREALANWLLCVTGNAADNRQLTFSTDPTGGDGIICDTESDETWPTEHVMVPQLPRDDARNAEEKILAAIEQKRAKGGAAYAAGKTLIVFLEEMAKRGFQTASRSACRSRCFSRRRGSSASEAPKGAGTFTMSPVSIAPPEMHRLFWFRSPKISIHGRSTAYSRRRFYNRAAQRSISSRISSKLGFSP